MFLFVSELNTAFHAVGAHNSQVASNKYTVMQFQGHYDIGVSPSLGPLILERLHR